MGQNHALTCKTSDQTIFAHQLKIYKWRADPNFNTFIPRVYFKSALAQRQQEKFSEFLQQQQHSQYLEISKFKQEMQSIQYGGDDQIILFQKYFCSLAQLKGVLTIEESLYALQGLLSGFQEITKIFQTILVDPSCCFVTTQGNIRAWINPNVKSNHVWKQHLGENSVEGIIYGIVKMAEDCTRPSNKSLSLFHHLHHLMNCQQNLSFASLRKWLNQYSYSQNIQLSKFIDLAGKKKQDPLVKGNKSYQRSIRKTQGSDPCKENDQLFMSTHGSQIYKDYKPLRAGGPPSIFQLRDVNLAVQPTKKSNNTTFLQLPKTSSQIYSKNNSQAKFSVLVQTQLEQAFQSMKNSDDPIANTKQYDKLRKNNSTQFFNNQQRGSKKPNILENSKKPFFLQKKPSFLQGSKKIMEKKIEVMIDRPPIRKDIKKAQKNQQCSQKKSMKVSIMQHFPEQDEIRKDNRYKTFAQNQYKQRQQSNKSLYISRPWITTKTITKLISDNDQASLKQSVGSSSDYYNGSVYSGVLTQMGRQVGKPIDIARSKTLKESQL